MERTLGREGKRPDLEQKDHCAGVDSRREVDREQQRLGKES